MLMGCHSHKRRTHPIFVRYKSITRVNILDMFGPPPECSDTN